MSLLQHRRYLGSLRIGFETPSADSAEQSIRSRKFQVPGNHFQIYKDMVHLTAPEMAKFLQEELA